MNRLDRSKLETLAKENLIDLILELYQQLPETSESKAQESQGSILTEYEKLLVSHSFSQVVSAGPQVSHTFYQRLFEIEPTAKELFHHVDMKEQGKKFIQTLSVVVGSVNHLPSITNAIHELGQRHVRYGVKKEQYQKVGEALIWALGKELGENFTAETQNAWVKIYSHLVQVAVENY